MPHKMCEYVSHHLRDLVHLEDIDLSQNNMSSVSSITLSNTKSHVALKLWSTNLPPELFKNICQLTSVVKLKELNLSSNNLTGCLHHLLSEHHQGLKSLEELDLAFTMLNKLDIEALTCALQRAVLLKLKYLNLQGAIQCAMYIEIDKLIKVCISHHKREVKLCLSGNNMPGEIEDKWNKLCKDTNTEVWF